VNGKVLNTKDSDSDKNSKASGEPEYNHNHGFDDEKGDYKVITGDHIGYRYEIKEFLGKGSFGTALRCYDHKDKRELAIKIVKNKKKYYYQASVELKILQYLR
jgi:dual specificity tyrosine-phosphorylation-regulated kinase 2/3/4